jgi:gamma-D-glutamyl-L-lysine dipeptidyl-peptidase
MGLRGITKNCPGLVLLVVLTAVACSAPQIISSEPPVFLPPTPPPTLPDTLHARLADIAFTIQVGAFSTTLRAARYADRLQAKGLDAYYFIDTDGLCKVRFEKFDTKEAALARAADLQSRRLIESFYVVQPRFRGLPREPLPDLRYDLVRTARRFIGTPYRWGGASVEDGFDCSGLTMTVYRLNGLDLPRKALSQFRAGTPVPAGALQRGDLVFFATGRSRQVSHVGIYSGQGKFIHAPGSGKRIRTAALSNSYFRKRYVGARRYF